MKIIIVSNRENPRTVDARYQIAAFLDSQGISHNALDVSELPGPAFASPEGIDALARRLGGEYALIVTLGGDGTLLHSARVARAVDAPVLGINFGHLGFLTNDAALGAIRLIADALAGEIVREKRMNLNIEVICAGDDEQPCEAPRRFFALNEIAIARGALGHILDFDFSISGDRIAHIRGDGLVVATATGSTAYALSAGGPLVVPSHRGLVVVPLAPHTLNSRAIVTEHNDVVEVAFELGGASGAEVSLFADGDALAFERPISSVIVSVGEEPTVLLTRREESFYKQLARTFFEGPSEQRRKG